MAQPPALQPDDNGVRYFAYQPQAEVVLLRERLQELELLRQVVAAGPAGITDYREWCEHISELALRLA